MEGEQNVKKGISEKRAVRKSKKIGKGIADLKAAAEGTDLVTPGSEESPTTPRRKASRSVGARTTAKKSGTTGAKGSRRKTGPASTATAPDLSSPVSAIPAPVSSSSPAPSERPEPPPILTVVQGQPPEAAAWEPTAEAPEPVGQPKPLEEPTFEQIQLRAYFIAERRRTAGIAGNEESDWLQAKEELSNELRGHYTRSQDG